VNLDELELVRAIEEKRMALGIPIKTFCAMAGLYRATYYGALNGLNLKADTLLKLLTAANIHIDLNGAPANRLVINGELVTKHDELLKRPECWEMILEKLKQKWLPSDIEIAFGIPKGSLTKKLLKEQEKDLYKIKMLK
jgi:hypothetical protein